jgi:hypothetical protein
MRLLEKPACLAIGSKLGSAFVALSAGSTHAGMSAAPISTNRPTTYRTSNVSRFLAERRGKEVQLALNKWCAAGVQARVQLGQGCSHLVRPLVAG